MSIQNYLIGNANFSALGDVLHLYSYTGTAIHYNTLVDENQNIYQIPANKALHIIAMDYIAESALATLVLGWGTASVADSASSPTGWKISSKYAISAPVAWTQYVRGGIDIVIPANATGYFPTAFHQVGNGGANLWCVLV